MPYIYKEILSALAIVIFIYWVAKTYNQIIKVQLEIPGAEEKIKASIQQYAMVLRDTNQVLNQHALQELIYNSQNTQHLTGNQATSNQSFAYQNTNIRELQQQLNFAKDNYELKRQQYNCYVTTLPKRIVAKLFGKQPLNIGADDFTKQYIQNHFPNATLHSTPQPNKLDTRSTIIPEPTKPAPKISVANTKTQQNITYKAKILSIKTSATGVINLTLEGVNEQTVLPGVIFANNANLNRQLLKEGVTLNFYGQIRNYKGIEQLRIFQVYPIK